MNTFVVLVEDHPGVLTRVSGLIRRRGFNIDSITVGHTETPGVSRMTIAVAADEFGARRIEANLYKLLEVLRVDNVSRRPSIFRELAILKVQTSPETRAQIFQLAQVYRARIIDVSPESLVIEITGNEDKVRSLIDVMTPYGILELARTGRLAMLRGTGTASKPPDNDDQPALFEADDDGVSHSV
ncbi:MAG: acetolactate synthase small subunit [Acidobacteria bacterium]|nr:acetolactate synthase small subunit [Acidobacteriota bacterium]